MIRNLYRCLVVAFRAIGLWLVGSALIGWLIGALLSGSGAAVALLFAIAPKVLGGIILWFVAKPAAALIVSGLEE